MIFSHGKNDNQGIEFSSLCKKLIMLLGRTDYADLTAVDILCDLSVLL